LISQLHRSGIDSEVFGFDVYSLDETSTQREFADSIRLLELQNSKAYVSFRTAIENVSQIHLAERFGFEFVETQFRTVLKLRKEFDTSKFPYDYIRIEDESKLQEALIIAKSTIEHDRFSRDPVIGKELSGERYERYLRDSFERHDDEIWCVQSRETGRLLTFRSHRIIDDREVSLLIGGVHPDFKNLGLGVVSSHFCFNQLRESNFKRAVTHISAANVPILNLEVGHFDFQVISSFVILRKLINF
jgi:hypothetical protein